MNIHHESHTSVELLRSSGNLPELQLLIQISLQQYCALVKLFLADNITINRNYHTYFKNHQTADGRPRGGVSISVHKSLAHSAISLNTPLQAIALRVTLHKVISVCSLYLPPSSPCDMNDLTNLLQQLPSPVVLLGDYNAHSPVWGCQNVDTRGRLVEDLIANNNLCLLNNKTPTYVHPATGSTSAIDLSLCSANIMTQFTWEVHDDLCGSDHFPIIIRMIKPVHIQTPVRWKLHKADWETFTSLCKEQLNSTDNISNIEHFTDQLVEISNKTIPKTSDKPKKFKPVWFTENCTAAIKERKKSLHQFQINRTTDNLTLFKIQRAKTRRTIREEKKESWRNYVNKLNTNTTSKEVWSMIRKINGFAKTPEIHHLNVNGNTITDVKDIADTIAASFSMTSSSESYSDAFKHIRKQKESRKLNFYSNNNEYYNNNLTTSELIQSIELSKDTSPGPDSIHYQMLKHLPSESLTLLLNLYNNIWNGGVFPDMWQKATVIPLVKPGKNSSDPNSYRPIALTSCLCKTFERIINKRLIYFLERNNIITEHQSGFRANRSTADQLIRLETWVREGFVNCEHVVTVFFDLEKAYDTTWKHGIMIDLHEAGLRGRLPLLIAKFLSNRNFKVQIGNTQSDLYPQENGVPQGSILSVTLFGVKINSIVKAVNPGTDCTVFVDDFSICYRSRQVCTIERQLQKNLIYKTGLTIMVSDSLPQKL